MRPEANAYFHDIALAAERVLSLVKNAAPADFQQNDMLRWAVERQLSIVGEAVYQLDQHYPDIAAEIPDYRDIIGFRHVLVHGYARVKDDLVWGIVEKNLRPLLAFAKSRLEST